MFDDTKKALRKKVAAFRLSAPDSKMALMTLRVYDDASVEGQYEAMPCEIVSQVMQIGNTILAQARTSQMVLQSRTPFVKSDVPDMQMKFLKTMVKEIAEAAKVEWSCTDKE